MNTTHLGSELTTLSAVGTIEVSTPTTGHVTGRMADHHRQVEPTETGTRESSHSEPVSGARKARRWCQRLLEIAAHNPPHPL
jgi:hypothetical protein